MKYLILCSKQLAVSKKQILFFKNNRKKTTEKVKIKLIMNTIKKIYKCFKTNCKINQISQK
ncbi:hypothetical protein PA0144 [Candidatus Phytoplasma australiense]|uniref:Uncharacterized protein n=2 Tax=Phytoplasma australiense TaxID=59748 RepID=B1V947_PHYAS|nr:Hypothetical Protein SLY_0884 [Strawberry lethal yellows phytoplasma (CPA) str. NZSb11]CAM11479.1 hypothetical protein PA0144 [Candidatus Phytoplasma australiense]